MIYKNLINLTDYEIERRIKELINRRIELNNEINYLKNNELIIINEFKKYLEETINDKFMIWVNLVYKKDNFKQNLNDLIKERSYINKEIIYIRGIIKEKEKII
jgi:hypothetical protein